MGLIKTLTVDERWKISVNCVKETLGLEKGNEVEIHVVDGIVEIRKKEKTNG